MKVGKTVGKEYVLELFEFLRHFSFRPLGKLCNSVNDISLEDLDESWGEAFTPALSIMSVILFSYCRFRLSSVLCSLTPKLNTRI